MTNEELNKWLAEKVMGYIPGESIGYASAWYFKKSANNIYETVIPISAWNPTEDRNQMARCVKELPENKQTAYLGNLMEICTGYEDWDEASWENMFSLVEASPRQRAEALYKTISEMP